MKKKQIQVVILLTIVIPNNLNSQTTTEVVPQEPAIPATYNFRLGKRTFLSSGAGVEFSYNDNLTLTNKNRKSDFIVSPSLQLGFIHSFNKQFRLRLSMDFSYVKHLNYNELDHFSITPNGGNDFEISLRAFERWIIRLSDTFSLNKGPIVRNTSIGFDGVTIFNNRLGVSADADYNNVVLGFSYSNNLSLHIEDRYDYLDLMAHSADARVGFRLTKPILLGLKSSISYLDYINNGLNNGISYSGQVYGNFVLARNLSATGSVGYQNVFFDNNGRKTNDDSDYGSIVFSAGLSHEIARNAQHSISLSKGMQPGYRSNYQDTLSLSYNISYSYTRYLTLDMIFDWLNYSSSKDFKDFSNKGDIYSITLSTGYSLTRYASVVMKYQFRWSEANNDGDYTNNIATLALNYRF